MPNKNIGNTRPKPPRAPYGHLNGLAEVVPGLPGAFRSDGSVTAAQFEAMLQEDLRTNKAELRRLAGGGDPERAKVLRARIASATKTMARFGWTERV